MWRLSAASGSLARRARLSAPSARRPRVSFSPTRRRRNGRRTYRAELAQAIEITWNVRPPVQEPSSLRFQHTSQSGQGRVEGYPIGQERIAGTVISRSAAASAPPLPSSRVIVVVDWQPISRSLPQTPIIGSNQQWCPQPSADNGLASDALRRRGAPGRLPDKIPGRTAR